MSENLRIVTWNINSVRLRMGLLERLAIAYKPDVICLQETKVQDMHFPTALVTAIGFDHVVYSGEKSYNGVAILSRHKIDDHFSLAFYNEDKRHIAARIKGIELHNFYVPAGGDEPDIEINPKYAHKLAYLELMHDWYVNNRKTSDNVILVGDLNIAPYEHDVWSSKQLKNVVSHTMPERVALNKLKASLNFIDTGRHFVSETEKLYSWWSYRNKDWQKSNRGRRLDHLWVTPVLQDKLVATHYIAEARAWDVPSDHIPCVIDIQI